METLDPRLGLPSASSMHRAALCPGSVALEARCPPEPPGPDAERGTRIHRWLSHRDVELPADEMETALACERMQQEALYQWMGDDGAEIINREERLWLLRSLRAGDVFAGVEPVCSGQADIVYAQANRALVIDYKTLWGEHDPAEVNYQLRTLTVVTAENSDGEIDEVTVLMVQPNKSREIRLVTYTSDDLLQAREEILAICEATKAPDAPRIPGESQCKHCRGKLKCPELRAHLAMVQAHVTPADLLPEDLAKVLDIAAAAKHLIAAAESEAKRRLAADPDSVPGWMLAEGNNRRHVDDPTGLFNAVVDTTNTEGFLSCIEVQVGKLEDLFAKSNKALTGQTQKDGASLFRRLAEPYITYKQNAPSLKRVKEITE